MKRRRYRQTTAEIGAGPRYDAATVRLHSLSPRRALYQTFLCGRRPKDVSQLLGGGVRYRSHCSNARTRGR